MSKTWRLKSATSIHGTMRDSASLPSLIPVDDAPEPDQRMGTLVSAMAGGPPTLIDENHPAWEMAVEFHSGDYDQKNPQERQRRKDALFPIRYGNFDLTLVYEAANKRAAEKENANG